jgi:hypothetical protein
MQLRRSSGAIWEIAHAFYAYRRPTKVLYLYKSAGSSAGPEGASNNYRGDAKARRLI